MKGSSTSWNVSRSPETTTTGIFASRPQVASVASTSSASKRSTPRTGMCSVSHMVANEVELVLDLRRGLGSSALVVLGQLVAKRASREIEGDGDSARGFWDPTSDTSIEAKPCSAFVTTPADVWISTGSAKNARKASDMPSSSTSGRWSASLDVSANELTLKDLLGNVTHARSSAHGGLLDHFEGRGLVESSLGHERFLSRAGRSRESRSCHRRSACR